jgi:hypothetical protein
MRMSPAKFSESQRAQAMAMLFNVVQVLLSRGTIPYSVINLRSQNQILIARD